MSDLAEDRVYDDRAGETVCYVATGVGVARVAVSGTRVGRFSLDHRCTARDVVALPAAGGDAPDPTVAVATDETVLALVAGTYHDLGYGPASAVGVHDGLLLAGDASGALAALPLAALADSDGVDGDDWTHVADLPAIRAIESPFVATAGGVYRLADDGPDHVGLDDVRDVAGGLPLAATAEGVYRLGPGWTRDLDGAFDTVAASDDGALAHAGGDAFHERRDGEWSRRALPADEGAVTDVGYAAETVVLTCDGTLALCWGDDWRARSLGLTDAVALAVVDG